MTNRLHVLLADTAIAERTVMALREQGIADEALHAVARHDPDHPLPDAGLLETTDIAGASGRGAMAGAATGALAGMAALVFPPLGLILGGAGVAASTLAGAGVGAWIASMIGVSESSDTVAAYEQAIADGQVLLLIDVPDDQQAALIERLEEIAPDADVQDAGAID
ncbi:DUF1269 domain-containing protein [Salinisphaera sp. Q1T1-3]|uniref:DUF1269 domain-containing protein n=1 Tax=Salinisphaera sp. Q1T1-3 TaxID=2321229 RepID=UPI000E710BC7|nr:DUF1269 domain-containing protein [Salinisphaera sp. Q1T1-3]RJS91397.1 DUF1269 domain-containing protein [Salinisphaera sp. Q1T1-3]